MKAFVRHFITREQNSFPIPQETLHTLQISRQHLPHSLNFY